MNAKQHRKLNAALLVREVGGVTSLAKLAGTAQSYLSQIIGPKAKREMGDELARRIEYVCGKPHGWMDASHIEETHLEKARQIHAALLGMPTEKLDALVTLLGLGVNPDSLGHVALGPATNPAGAQVRELGVEQIGRSKKPAPSKGRAAGKGR